MLQMPQLWNVTMHMSPRDDCKRGSGVTWKAASRFNALREWIKLFYLRQLLRLMRYLKWVLKIHEF